MRGKLAILCIPALLCAACKPKLSARVEQRDDGVVVFGINTDRDVVVTVQDKSCNLSNCQIFVPARDFPIGENKVSVVADKKGKKTTVDLTFTRKKIEAKAKLETRDVGHTPCGGELCGKDELKANDDGTLDLIVHVPLGVEVTIDEVTAAAQIPSVSYFTELTLPTLKVDLKKHIFHQSLADLTHPTGKFVSIPVTITADETKETELKIGAGWVRDYAGLAVLDIDKHAITFKGDKPAGDKPRSVFLIDAKGNGLDFAGADATLESVDLIAKVVELPSRNAGGCGSFTGSSGTTTVVKSAYDVDVTVYDRRTGKVKTKKRFLAPYVDCPSSVTSYGGGDDVQDVPSHVDTKTVVAWLPSVLPKK